MVFVETAPGDSVALLKVKIATATGIRPPRQRLGFSGVELKDECTVYVFRNA